MPIGYFKKLFKGRQGSQQVDGVESLRVAGGSPQARRRDSSICQALRTMSVEEAPASRNAGSEILHIHNTRLLFGSNKEMNLCLAETIEDRRRAWSMVYQRYRAKGFIPSRPSGLWCGTRKVQSDHTTFSVEHQGNLVATLSLIFDSQEGLPAEDAFVLDSLRRKGKVCQVVGLVNEAKGPRGAETLKLLFKMVYVTACLIEEYDHLVILVRPRHAEFYQRALAFEPIGRERSHKGMMGMTVVPLHLDLTSAEAKLAKRFRAVPKERNLHRYFLSRSGELRSWVRRNRRPADQQGLRELSGQL